MSQGPDIQGVILIDTWANDALADWYDRIAVNTADYNIKCCVNACYGIDISGVGAEATGKNDVSMRNTVERHAWKFYEQQQTQNSDLSSADNRLLLNMIKHSNNRFRTDPRLHTPNLLGNSASVCILEPQDLLHHCQMYHNNSIKNWLVIGQAWLMCLHFRPMGLYNLSTFVMSQGWNVYVTPWSIRDRNGDPVSNKSFNGTDGITWQPVRGFGYRLAGYNSGK